MADRVPIGPAAAFDHDDAHASRSGSSRGFVLWLFAFALVLLAVVYAFDWKVDATGVTGRSTKWQVVENAKDRTIKLDRYEAMVDAGDAPETLLLGSSRVMKFEPSVVEELTDRRALNAAVSGATTEDVLLFTKLVADTQPDDFPHLVWGVDSDAFRDKAVRDGLSNDPRVAPYLTTRERVRNKLAQTGVLLEWQTLRTSVESVRRGGPAATTRASRTYAADGFQEWELHPVATDEALLRRQVAEEIRQYAQSIFVRDDFTEVRPEPTDQFRDAIRIANRHGDVPTVFLTPYQPYGEELLAKYDAAARQREVARLLTRLQDADGLDFRFVDLADLASFGGDPRAFYDGVHMTTVNTRRALETLDGQDLLAPPD